MGKGDTHTKKHTKSRFIKYELEFANKEEGEFYAKVIGLLGGNRLKVKNIIGDEFQVIVRGNFYFGSKKENLNFPDADRCEYWVLVQPGISKGQYFLKHIYNDSDKVKLYERGELSNNSSNINTIEIIHDSPEEEPMNDDWIDNI
jgi:hypothetical protein